MNKPLSIAISTLMLTALAIVAFSKSPKVQEAALAPITVGVSPPAGVIPSPPMALATASGSPVVMHDDAPPAAPPAFNQAEADSCEAQLKTLGVVFEPQAPIQSAEACGAERPLKVSSVGGLELKPAIITRCEPARALAVWTKYILIPSAKLHLNAKPTALTTGDSYQCRTRRGGGEFKVSEHAYANAVDITGVAFADHAAVPVMDRPDSADPARDFQAAIRGGACAYFTTVLGPGANSAHADHLHFDLIQRKNGYRICE
jgi:hypothetical protein